MRTFLRGGFCIVVLAATQQSNPGGFFSKIKLQQKLEPAKVAADTSPSKAVVLISNWAGAKATFKWLWLETPENDGNVWRRFDNNGYLLSTHRSTNYNWTLADLNRGKLNDFTYTAVTVMIEPEHTDASLGMVLQAKKAGGEKPVMILFMVNAQDQTYWFGSYDQNNQEWKTYNAYQRTQYNIFHKAIKKYDGNGVVNRLKIQKDGTQMRLFINNQIIETVTFTESNKVLEDIFGIGVTSYQKGKGGVASISFQLD